MKGTLAIHESTSMRHYIQNINIIICNYIIFLQYYAQHKYSIVQLLVAFINTKDMHWCVSVTVQNWVHGSCERPVFVVITFFSFSCCLRCRIRDLIGCKNSTQFCFGVNLSPCSPIGLPLVSGTIIGSEMAHNAARDAKMTNDSAAPIQYSKNGNTRDSIMLFS